MVQIHGIRRASADAKYRQMTGQPVKPLILKLCLPAVISNLVTTAYNLTDTFFIGQLGTAQSGAIGIAFSIMTVMQALGFFFGNGAGNSMSRELGKQNNERASRLLAVGFAGAVLSGLVIATIGLLTLRPLVVMLGSTSTIAPYAVQYLTPLLVAAPCVCGSFALNGLLRYQGQSTFGMIGLVSGALLNFLLAPLFIFVLHLGIFGAGLATAICQTVSFTILTTMSRKFGVMKLSLRNCRPDVLLMREVAGGGLPSLIRQGAGSISVTCVNIAANPFGDAAIAGMAIVMRIMLGANSVIVGLGQGFQPVCGYLPLRPGRGRGGCGRAAYPMLHGDSQRLQHDGQYDDPDHGPHWHRLIPGPVPTRSVFGTDRTDSADDVRRARRGNGTIGVRRADIPSHYPVHAANPA